MLIATPRRLLVILVAVGTLASTAAGTAVVGTSLDDPEDGPVPEGYEEGDTRVDYDRGNYQIGVTAAEDNSMEYRLTIVGAVEPASEAGEDSVRCIRELCIVSGEVAPDETITYNVSGTLVAVEPNENLTVSIEGSFDGDAAIGIGAGQARGAVSDVVGNVTANDSENETAANSLEQS